MSGTTHGLYSEAVPSLEKERDTVRLLSVLLQAVWTREGRGAQKSANLLTGARGKGSGGHIPCLPSSLNSCSIHSVPPFPPLSSPSQRGRTLLTKVKQMAPRPA